METHSRILIQNCVLDILFLTYVMFAQMFYIIDADGNSVLIFTDGIFIEFIKNNFDKIICKSFILTGNFFYITILYGLCAQFVFRYLILNRNMTINYRTYLFYMFSTVFVVGSFYNLICIFYAMNYFDGGIKHFDEEYLNKTLPFVIMKSEVYLPALIMTFVIVILPYLIIFICGFKMVYYVNLHTGLSQNMKRLLKQLTKTLIILIFIPFINQIFILLVLFFIAYNNRMNSSTKENDILNLIYIFLSIFTHFMPVFNPIVCIITNKPYKEAVFKTLRIHPQ
nr:unnamed protein product [Meloidogyne enterolobii]